MVAANIFMDEFGCEKPAALYPELSRVLGRQPRRGHWRKAAAIIAAGVLSAAAASAYFFFPTASASVLKGAAAVVTQSWDDAFGAANGIGWRTVEVDISGSDVALAELSDGGDGTVGGVVGETADGVAGGGIAGVASAAGDGSTAAPADGTALPAELSGEAALTDNAAIADPAPPPPSPPLPSSSSPPPLPCAVSATAVSLTHPSYDVVVNEVAWMGSAPLAGETASKAANREWIELKNMTAAAVDISGW